MALSDLSNRKMSFLSSYFKIDKRTRKYVSDPIKKLFKNKAVQNYFLKAIKESKKYKMQEFMKKEISLKNNKLKS